MIHSATKLSLLSVLLCILLSACSGISSYTQVVHPYRPDIVQGNWVTQEMVNQLKVGMSYEQVKFLLGSPMLIDVFHQTRWEYIYRFQAGRDQSAETRRLSVYFANDRLEKWSNDPLPDTQPFASDKSVPKKTITSGQQPLPSAASVNTVTPITPGAENIAPSTQLP